MKKVGIMTWYQHKNYGTTLQALALIEAVRRCGYIPFGINYISKGYDRQTTLEKLCSARKIVNGLKRRWYAKKFPARQDALKNERYTEFVYQNIPMGLPTQTSSQLFRLNEECSAFICGSDQIWTPMEYNSKYFLDFVDDDRKKIAYAPSFGTCEIRDVYVRDEIGKQLKTFQALSVRERQGADIIKKLYGLNAEIVLDPTLLLDATAWERYEKTAVDSDGKILCYFLGENENFWKKIRNLSAKRRQEVLVIPVHGRDYVRGFKVLDGVGPAEFLHLMKRASLICTDSFHGTIFSVLNHRDFITFKRFSDKDPASQNSRIINLLETLCLEDHLWNEGGDVAETDWNNVDSLLEVHRKKSVNFLQNALDMATSEDKSVNTLHQVTNTCCGCGVCVKVCERKAIHMELKHGFYQAVIDHSICTGCRLCRKVCAFNGSVGADLEKSQLYEAKSVDKNVLKKSTSGGIPHEILSYMSRKGYPVFACLYDYEKGVVKHELTERFDAGLLSRYQGSKYLQSKFFNEGLYILEMDCGVITGTPCQTAAADNYLRMKGRRDDFILIDLICHGVPSLDLWEAYLADEKIKKDEINEIKFRDPEKGWRDIYIRSPLKTISRKEKDDLFYQFFDMQSCYMKSCYECNFRTTSRADIRLGDYWGKKYTKYDLEYGVSMVSTFTDKGKELLLTLMNNENIVLNERPISDYYNGQGPANPVIPLYYDELLADLAKSNVRLKELIYKHCYIKYLNKKLQIQKSKLRKVIYAAADMFRGREWQ